MKGHGYSARVGLARECGAGVGVCGWCGSVGLVWGCIGSVGDEGWCTARRIVL